MAEGAQGRSARNVPLVLCVEYLHGDGADTTGGREEAHEEGGGRSPHDAPWRCHRRRRSALAISGYLACYGAASSADSSFFKEILYVPYCCPLHAKLGETAVCSFALRWAVPRHRTCAF